VIDFYNLPDDKKTWDLLATGKTAGIFQLDNESLGGRFSKKVEPKSIADIAAVTTILRPGCVSQDTEISVSFYTDCRGITRVTRKTIKEIFEAHKRKASRYIPQIISLNEENNEFFVNEISEVWYNGKKECFSVEVSKYSNGVRKHRKAAKKEYLECTADHKMLTSKFGWVALDRLHPGERIAIVKTQANRKRFSDTICNRHHPEAPRQKNVDGTRNFTEICYKHYEEACVNCEWKKTTLDVHHIDGDRHEDNSPENLCFLCPNCHREHNNGLLSTETILEKRKKYVLPQTKDIMWVTYLGKKSVGIKDVYDITVSGPNHNYIAGNMVVHNCLQARLDDGESASIHYDRRHRGVEPIESFHPLLEDILKDTHQIILYQEQTIAIAKKLAGFNGAQAMKLMKGIGKKKADLIMQLETEFVEGCIKNNIERNDAQKIFDVIKKSARYSFNKCLHKNTRLKRPDGTTSETLEELYLSGDFGDGVSINKSGISVSNPILNIAPAGKQITYLITIWGGEQISVTKNHKFPTERGDITVSDIMKLPENEQKLLVLKHDTLKISAIVGIDQCEEVETYDVTMLNDPHNFVVESGIVTCNSHAVAYSHMSYCDAYLKANETTIFYVANLRLARHKMNGREQIRKLVKEAETFGILCKPPRLDNCYVDFTEHDEKIYFGISNIKGIGEKKAQAIVDLAPGPDTWYKCLFKALDIGKATVEGCIKAGVFAKYKIPVRRQIDDLNNMNMLSIGEKKYAIAEHHKFDNFVDLLTHVKNEKATLKRQDKLDSIIKLMNKPPEELKDNLRDTTAHEVELFGTTISYDNIDTVHTSGNCSVNDYNEGKEKKLYQIVVEVERVKVHEITKGVSKGKNMCFVSVFDHSGKMDVVMFDSAYDEFAGFLYEGATLMLKGKRGRQKGLVVEEVLQVV
jgi:hypothetical protein